MGLGMPFHSAHGRSSKHKRGISLGITASHPLELWQSNQDCRVRKIKRKKPKVERKKNFFPIGRNWMGVWAEMIHSPITLPSRSSVFPPPTVFPLGLFFENRNPIMSFICSKTIRASRIKSHFQEWHVRGSSPSGQYPSFRLLLSFDTSCVPYTHTFIWSSHSQNSSHSFALG